jgi:uncharacterized protein YegP (UPF0339 family)
MARPAMTPKVIRSLVGDQYPYNDGIAILSSRNPKPPMKKGMTKTYTFMLYAYNGEKLIRGSHPYNRKASAIKTLDSYFPRFFIVDKTEK